MMERHTQGKNGTYSRAQGAGGHRNGIPLPAGYTWSGDRTGMTEAEVQVRIAAVRAKLATGPVDEAGPGGDSPFTPDPEWYRELDEDSGTPPAPTASVASFAPLVIPYTHRTAFYAGPPAAPSTRFTKPPAARAPRRCRRCGYLKIRCACGGAP